MLRKLSNFFSQNQSAKILDLAEVNSSELDINISCLQQLKPLLHPPAIDQLIKELERGWTSRKPTEKLKYYIVTHYIVGQTTDKEIACCCAQYRNIAVKLPIFKDEGPQSWIQTNIVDYYSQYVQKLCSNIEIYRYCKQVRTITLQDVRSIQLTTSCFKVVNLVNFILNSQVSLNKIGRYYPKLTVMCQLFAMYVKDIKTFYNYMQLSLDAIFAHYTDLDNEMLRHSFVYVVQVQKTLDSLQEFFHNRYFYKTVDVELPHVQQVDSNKYKTLVKYIRMTDKTIDIPRVITLPSRQQKLYDLNSTMMVEQGRHRRHTSVLEQGQNCISYLESPMSRFEEKFSTMHNNMM